MNTFIEWAVFLLPTDLKTWLWTGASGIAVAILAYRRSARENRRNAARAAHLSVRSRPMKNGRRAGTAQISSWTGAPLQLQRVRFVRPYFIRGRVLQGEGERFYADSDTGDMAVTCELRDKHTATENRKVSFDILLPPPPWWRVVLGLKSRVAIDVFAQTLDADNRVERLRLHSAPVDWSLQPAD